MKILLVKSSAHNFTQALPLIQKELGSNIHLYSQNPADKYLTGFAKIYIDIQGRITPKKLKNTCPHDFDAAVILYNNPDGAGYFNVQCAAAAISEKVYAINSSLNFNIAILPNPIRFFLLSALYRSISLLLLPIYAVLYFCIWSQND